MSNYVDASVLKKVQPTQPHWTTIYHPGDKVPVSGIYRCQGCHLEIAANHPDHFPPQNRHQHTDEQGPIAWKLNVRAHT
ncbi:protein L [Roseateles noduli]|uniref:protein L n=1 Tax=Roseateles noduli TaxID=2052484 RepID=UPI003D65F3A0